MGASIRYGAVIAGEPEIQAVIAVLRSQDWASGQLTEEFEQAAARWQGCEHALFVNSGSSALLLALSNLPPGSRVAMPATQFATLYGAARWCGLLPVLVDCDDSLNMSPAALEKAAKTERLRAAAFVHLAGNPAGIGEIAALCETYSLTLIEDACEAFGASAAGKKAGNFGMAAAVSTHAAHHISTGEGGLVFTGDERWYRKMKRIRDWGRSQGHRELGDYYPGYSFSEAGLNLHASDIQAALGLAQMRRLEGFIAARRRNYQILREGLAGLPLTFPRTDPGDDPSWYTFPILLPGDTRVAFMAHLVSRGIESRPIVAGNMARQPVCDQRGAPAAYPESDEVFFRGLWVSVHPALSDADLDTIIAAFRDYFR